ncbi:MAG: hypothetical protein WDN47_01385 [Candidatus Doudnabacteria bacterium]
MNKKALRILVVLLIVLLLFVLFLKDRLKQIAVQQTPITATDDYLMSGDIQKVEGSLITVKGSIRSTKPGDDRTDSRVIQFSISPQTTIEKIALIAPADVKSGVGFYPETKVVAGSMSDLKAGTRIMKIQTKEDLFNTNKAVATDINYASLEFPSGFLPEQ